MPISIQIDPQTGIAITTCSGVLRLDDARESAKVLWETRDWPGERAVWDFRAAEFDVTTSDTREIAQFILQNQPSPPPSKVAFVTPRDVDFGMARMYEVFREDPRSAFRVFRDYDEAISWVRPLDLGAA